MCSQGGDVEKDKVTNRQGLPLEGATLGVANPSSGVRGCGKSKAAEEKVPPGGSCGLDQHLPPSRAGSREQGAHGLGRCTHRDGGTASGTQVPGRGAL